MTNDQIPMTNERTERSELSRCVWLFLPRANPNACRLRHWSLGLGHFFFVALNSFHLASTLLRFSSFSNPTVLVLKTFDVFC